MFVTSARSPYYFSLHASDPRDPDGGSRKDTGHTLICGPTGSGKTVFIGFLSPCLPTRRHAGDFRQGPRARDSGARAGRRLFSAEEWGPTGFNPLQLPTHTVEHRALKGWLRELSGQPAAVGEHSQHVAGSRPISSKRSGVFLALDISARRLSRLVEFLDPTDPEGLYARLASWCSCRRGDYAWVFDNPVDTMAHRFEGCPVIGFDVT